MFAKQLPKMLEGLGIKLDGDGKFTLNPLKKFEEGALGGKNITGMARGALVGTAGMLSGAGVGAGLSGAWRGLTSGKGWKETGKTTAEMNRKMRQAKLDGSTFGGRLGARFAGTMGMPTTSERLSAQDKNLEERIKKQDELHKSFESIKSQVGSAIEGQKLGSFSNRYNQLKADVETAKTMKESLKRDDFGDDASFEAEVARRSKALIDAENAVSKYLKKDAVAEYYNKYRAGTLAPGEKIIELENVFKQYDEQVVANGGTVERDYATAKSKDEQVTTNINELQNQRIQIRKQKEKANADQEAIK